MELEGDGFFDAGGIRSETLDSDEVNAPSVSPPIQEGEEDALNAFTQTRHTLKPERGK